MSICTLNVLCLVLVFSVSSWAFQQGYKMRPIISKLSFSKADVSELVMSAGKEPPKLSDKVGLDRLNELLQLADKEPDSKPPFYEPGPYPYQVLAALAYVIPIVDAADLGKYMFEAYPQMLTIYNSLYGPLSGIYNGVPFLPFAVFFLMSYICRAPNFPVEIRFHTSQAFMIALIQFIPSILFGFLEKSGVPMAIPYNTVFTWVMVSATAMQISLLNPLGRGKNPFLLNILNWSMRYMGYSSDMFVKK